MGGGERKGEREGYGALIGPWQFVSCPAAQCNVCRISRAPLLLNNSPTCATDPTAMTDAPLHAISIGPTH